MSIEPDLLANALVLPTNHMLSASLGQRGTCTVTDTALRSFPNGCMVIQILEDTVFEILTDVLKDTSGNSEITGITYLAPMTIYGRFTAIKLTSGKVRLYKI